MPLEKRSASQVVTFAPSGPAYAESIIAAGTAQSGGSSLPWLAVPPLLSSASGYPPAAGDVFQLWTAGGTLKEPTLFQISSVVPSTAYNSWQVFFSPLPKVTPAGGDQAIFISRPTSPRWLGAIGHVTGLTYSFSCPGGPDSMSCTFQIPPEYRTDAMNPGRIVQIFRGGGCVWEGILDEPQPTAAGWTLTGHGAGTFGTNFTDIYNTSPSPPAGTGWLYPDDHVNEAITRGLRWVNPGIGSPAGVYLSQQQDSGSETITDFLNLMCTGGSLLWDVQEGQGSSLPSGAWQLRVYPYQTAYNSGSPVVVAYQATPPLATLEAGTPISQNAVTDTAGDPKANPTRLLVASTPVARTIAADINTLVLYYQVTPDISFTNLPNVAATFNTITVVDTASIRKHGVMEYFVDLSSAGVMSLSQASTVGANILSRYVRANWAGPFTVGPGQYLNSGGVPVDLGCEHAGVVAQLIVSDASLGGEVGPGPITFLIGEYEFDNDTDTATITPFAGVRRDMASLIAALYPVTF